METFHAWSKATPPPSPRFFRLESHACPNIGLVGRSDWTKKKIKNKIKKKPTKKSQEALEWEALVPEEYVES